MHFHSRLFVVITVHFPLNVVLGDLCIMGVEPRDAIWVFGRVAWKDFDHIISAAANTHFFPVSHFKFLGVWGCEAQVQVVQVSVALMVQNFLIAVKR
jgi:hypothetical protein